MKVYCPCCGRQVARRGSSGERTVSGVYAKTGFKNNEAFCDECSRDLDENGMFPEERSMICDADIIAAAPDLLDACEFALDALVPDSLISKNNLRPDDHADIAGHKLRDAVRKARGDKR